MSAEHSKYTFALICPFCHDKALAYLDTPSYEGACGCGAEFWGVYDDEKSTFRTRWKPSTGKETA